MRIYFNENMNVCQFFIKIVLNSWSQKCHQKYPYDENMSHTCVITMSYATINVAICVFFNGKNNICTK